MQELQCLPADALMPAVLEWLWRPRLWQQIGGQRGLLSRTARTVCNSLHCRTVRQVNALIACQTPGQIVGTPLVPLPTIAASCS
jgi:hypothetical protein